MISISPSEAQLIIHLIQYYRTGDPQAPYADSASALDELCQRVETVTQAFLPHITYFMLFTGIVYSITAFPVLCRILTELKLLDTNVSVGNDVIGRTLLALSVALVNARSVMDLAHPRRFHHLSLVPRQVRHALAHAQDG
jgi:hypothetical protein